MSTRIILADDHAILRHGLSKLIQQQEDQAMGIRLSTLSESCPPTLS